MFYATSFIFLLICYKKRRLLTITYSEDGIFMEQMSASLKRKSSVSRVWIPYLLRRHCCSNPLFVKETLLFEIKYHCSKTFQSPLYYHYYQINCLYQPCQLPIWRTTGSLKKPETHLYLFVLCMYRLPYTWTKSRLKSLI